MKANFYENQLLRGIEALNPSERTLTIEFQNLSDNYQHYLLIKQLFIKFHLYDQTMLKICSNKSYFLDEIELDRSVIEILNPKLDKRNMKHVRRNYTSIFKRLNSFFHQVAEPIRQLKVDFQREGQFFDLFGQNESSLIIWEGFKELFNSENPLAMVHQLFIENSKKSRVNIADLERMDTELMEQYTKGSYWAYERVLQDIEADFRKNHPFSKKFARNQNRKRNPREEMKLLYDLLKEEVKKHKGKDNFSPEDISNHLNHIVERQWLENIIESKCRTEMDLKIHLYEVKNELEDLQEELKRTKIELNLLKEDLNHIVDVASMFERECTNYLEDHIIDLNFETTDPKILVHHQNLIDSLKKLNKEAEDGSQKRSLVDKFYLEYSKVFYKFLDLAKFIESLISNPCKVVSKNSFFFQKPDLHEITWLKRNKLGKNEKITCSNESYKKLKNFYGKIDSSITVKNLYYVNDEGLSFEIVHGAKYEGSEYSRRMLVSRVTSSQQQLLIVHPNVKFSKDRDVVVQFRVMGRGFAVKDLTLFDVSLVDFIEEKQDFFLFGMKTDLFEGLEVLLQEFPTDFSRFPIEQKIKMELTESRSLELVKKSLRAESPLIVWVDFWTSLNAEKFLEKNHPTISVSLSGKTSLIDQNLARLKFIFVHIFVHNNIKILKEFTSEKIANSQTLATYET